MKEVFKLSLLTIVGLLCSISAFPQIDVDRLDSIMSKEPDFLYGGLAYNIVSHDSLTCEVAFYSYWGRGNIVIPETVTYDEDTFTVVGIGDLAFFGSDLTGVNIPNSVTSIGDWAFRCCFELTSVNIPNSVTSIGEEAFAGCTGLTSIDIPNSVTSIGNDAFGECTGLTSVNIPNSVTSLNGTFWWCTSLTSVNIPNSVTSLNGAFGGCTSLTSVNIPNSVTSIGNYTFYNCSGLTSIDIPNSVTSIGDSVFYGCSRLTSIDIPNSVTSISNGAFSCCVGLTNFTIEKTVKNIGNLAFANCSSLSDITIPNSVETMGDGVFSGCTNLKNISIPNSIESIGDSVFQNCSNLPSITIPNNIKKIGNYAFKGCSSLETLIMEDGPGTLTLGYNNYYYRNSLPKQYLCDHLFINCPLKTIYWGRNLSYVIPYWGYEYSIYLGENKELMEVTISKSVTSVKGGLYGKKLIIEDGEDSLSVSANPVYLYLGRNIKGNFGSSLTEVTISNSVTGIGDKMFSGCSGLTDIIIPNSVTNIGYSAFASCSGLKSITLGSSVSNIGERVFYNCGSLANIYSLAKTPPVIKSSTFSEEHYSSAAVYVPQGALSAYQDASYWQYFNCLKEDGATGIGTVGANEVKPNATYYDMQGRRLGALKKGLNIINGKKVIMRK